MTKLLHDPGSFRDPNNQVCLFEGRIVRGLSDDADANWRDLVRQDFFKRLLEAEKVIETRTLEPEDAARVALLEQGWTGGLEHTRIPFISYPYEWCFSMLKDAALLHLDLIEQCMENGWTMKDATAYNIQWIGAHPVFIDVVSFEPHPEGEAWIGYRQFCQMFLYPLMLKAHLDIDYLGLLRSNLDGLPAIETVKYFRGTGRFRKGVLSHLVFPASVERSISRRERDMAPAKKRKAGKHTKAMILGLVQGLKRTVSKLNSPVQHTSWSHYDKTHSYDEDNFEAKKAFVDKWAAHAKPDHAWDLGCNTGIFSKILSKHANTVIALDGDHDAIEQLYRKEKEINGKSILPLVMNLSNISPNHGWGGSERLAFDNRTRPDLVICLALIHHISLSANIPIRNFLSWIRTLNCSLIIEYVTREDEMVKKLLTNKTETFPDYNQDNFESTAREMFDIISQEDLKSGHRIIYYLEPK